MSRVEPDRVGVVEGPLGESDLPLLVRPAGATVRLIDWNRTAAGELAPEASSYIDERLSKHGGILFRGFDSSGIDEFERFISSLSDEILDYTFRSTPRNEVSGKIYTSTEYPAEKSIPMHNEMSYTTRWPRKIWFYCVQPATEGGETPIADSCAVYRSIDPEIRAEFEAKGVRYVRNYLPGIDLPWQEVFQTQDKREVERLCGELAIEFEWVGEEGLRTRQTCRATTTHPETGEPLWFNQAHLFHISSADPTVRDFLLAELGEENLPRHAYFGDGTPIPEAALDAIRAAYERLTTAFAWRQGDLLMLDNMRIAHGRRPFKGPRRVVVGMAEECSE